MDPSTQVLCMSWAFDDEDEVALWHRQHPWIERSERPDELLEDCQRRDRRSTQRSI
jgi:phage terminase large subunit-like protein